MKRVLITVFLTMAFLCLPAGAQDGKLKKSSAQDLLVKSEVETAVSMLQAIFMKHQQGEMSFEQAKKLGADLLRELRYGTEGYFWADTIEGVNVVLYGKKDVEGINRLNNIDKNGVFYIKELLAAADRGGSYVEYLFPEKGKNEAQAKRSYALLFKPFGWVVGSGYYLDTESQNNASVDELKQFVEKGAELISQKGEKAFDAFRETGSKWLKGDRYLFVWDLNGLRYVYPPNRKGEGENIRDIKDIDGKPIGELFIKTASSKEGKGWVHYRWPKPGEQTPSWKNTYIMKVKSPSGKAYFIGSGAYDMPVQKSFILDTVDSAVKLIESKGSKAFNIFRSKQSQYIYQDTYIFVISENGTELFNAAFPKLEGRNVIKLKDTNENYFVQEFIDVAKSRGAGWVDYPWPKPGDSEKSIKSTYVKKTMIGSKMVVVCAGVYKSDTSKTE